MIRITFTEEQLQQLHHGRFHHPHPRVQLKMEALLLKSQNLPHRQICRLLSISENTLRAYFRDFLAGGVEKLKELNFFRPVMSRINCDASVWRVFQRAFDSRGVFGDVR